MTRTPATAGRAAVRRVARAVRTRVAADPYRALAVALALLAAVAVFGLSREVFPYHSANHDEAVYLQQAAMLLDGRLFLRPPVPEAMRPWFFVRDGARLYPKYAPVPAAVFALGKALAGSYRVSLAAVAAANVALCYAVAAEAFDRRTGALAAALLLASPLFLVNSAVFLPYAPTTALNLAFALSYVRAARGEAPGAASPRTLGYAAVAGATVGLAFFARPFTAVLFAAPFVAHASWRLWRSRLGRSTVASLGTTAAVGSLGVVLALAYNAATTGSPLVFPYQAFAPLDGVGFGYREILGHGREYTPALALRANVRVLRLLFARWVVAGPAGAALAVVGLAVAVRGIRRRGIVPADRPAELGDRQVQVLLAGVVASVAAGNVLFWGNLNVLGALAEPGDGLVALLGPYYHFDALVPTAAFAAAGAASVAGRFREYCNRFPRARARGVFLAGLLVGGVALGGAAAAAVEDPIRANATVTDRYERAYAPFANATFDDALVLLPGPYGDWLNHPFQPLRNDPGYDGDVVYALDEGAGSFALVDEFPDRTVYRYAYRGVWAPTAGATVDPRLQPVRVVEGDRVELAASLGVPDGVESVTIRLATDEGEAYYTVDGTPSTVSIRLSVAQGRVRIAGPRVEPVDEDGPVTVAAADDVTLEAFLDAGAGRGFAYRLALPVERTDGTVRAMTPAVAVCRAPVRCGAGAAYVPRVAPAGVSANATLTAT